MLKHYDSYRFLGLVLPLLSTQFIDLALIRQPYLICGIKHLPQSGYAAYNISVEVEIHMKQKLVAWSQLISVGTEGLAGVGVVFEEITSEEPLEEVSSKGHGSARDYIADCSAHRGTNSRSNGSLYGIVISHGHGDCDRSRL